MLFVVVTGETIYVSNECSNESITETQGSEESPSKVEENSSAIQTSTPETPPNDLSLKKETSASHENGCETVPMRKVEKDRNKHSPRRRVRSVRNQSQGNEDRKIEFVRKGSRKEKEALDAFVNWKTQGKQGAPPANLKVSL